MTLRRGAAGFSLAATALMLATTVRAEPMTTYTVRAGDTLYELASRYLTAIGDYRVLQKVNHIGNPRRLPIGADLSAPTRLLRTTPIIARLGAFRGQVTVSLDGRPLSPAPGLAIEEGYLVSTGANSFARLDLPDGSRLALPSQSRVRVTRLRHTAMTDTIDRDFTIEAGRSESTVTHMVNPQDHYVVRTPVSVSAVRGTQFRVWYLPDDQLASTEVVSGAVAVTDGQGQGPLVPALYGASVTADGVPTPIPLPPPPRMNDPAKVQDEAQLAFNVEPSPAAALYRAELATDAGFLDAFAETISPDPRLNFDNQPDGTYFVRLTVVGASRLESIPATYAFKRSLNTLDLQAPSASVQDHRQRYFFRWEAVGDGTRSYRFQLRKAGAEAGPLVDEPGLTEQQITVTDLPSGVYNWRVMSRTFSHGRYVEKWSPVQTFQSGA